MQAPRQQLFYAPLNKKAAGLQQLLDSMHTFWSADGLTVSMPIAKTDVFI